LLAIARILILFGVVLLILGGLFFLLAKTGVTIGHLPGDVRIERGNFTCVLALGTSILLSIILTLLLNIIARSLGK
jgi:hypothetical protein